MDDTLYDDGVDWRQFPIYIYLRPLPRATSQPVQKPYADREDLRGIKIPDNRRALVSVTLPFVSALHARHKLVEGDNDFVGMGKVRWIEMMIEL